jgi:hypothetical protein
MRVGSLVKYTDACCRDHSVVPEKLLKYYGFGIVLFVDDVSTLRVRRNEVAQVHVHWTKQGTEWEPYNDLEVVSESR